MLLQIFIAPSMSRLKDRCSGIAPFHSSREVGTPKKSSVDSLDFSLRSFCSLVKLCAARPAEVGDVHYLL